MSNNNRSNNQSKGADQKPAPIVESSMPVLNEEVPKQTSEASVEPEVKKDEEPLVDPFYETAKSLGFKNPEFLKSPLGPQPSPETKKKVLKAIQEELDQGRVVLVEATREGGDYPSRVRRNLGEQFKLKEARHFSFNWMKLVIK